MPISEKNTAEPDQKKRFNRIRVFYRLYRKRLIASFVVIAHIAGALTSVEAIMENRTPQGAIAWAISLNLFPYGAVPAYWVFGHSEFEGYLNDSQATLAEMEKIRKKAASSLAAKDLDMKPDGEFEKTMQAMAGLGFTRGNRPELLINGEETYEAMLEAIGDAESLILMQFYIIRDDKTGNGFKDALLAKAKEGVAVYVMYDEIGSLGLDEKYVNELIEGGVHVKAFTTNKADGRKYQLNFRNHRKILVVDGKTGFAGGLNLGDEYLGKHERLTPWRDTHMQVTGPAAMALQLPFLQDWHWLSGETIAAVKWEPEAAPDGDSTVLCLATGPGDGTETCELFFLAAINSAEERLWIATPYFVPDNQIVSALRLADMRGVDVRIMLPGIIDSKLVKYSSFSYVDALRDTGVRFYRYGKGFTHQKVTLVDDDLACVGSANFDNRSFRLNFEIIMAVTNEDFAGKVAAMLENDFSNSSLVPKDVLDKKSFVFRLSSKVARLLAPIQ